MIHHLPNLTCLNCGATHECTSASDLGYPEPGDLTICVHCQAVLVFVVGETGLTYRLPQLTDLLSKPPEFLFMIALTQAETRRIMQQHQALMN